MAGRVTHPNVARVFDLGVDDGFLYITMEHVLGTSLCGRLRSGPLPIDDIASIGHQVALALAAAHDAGVVHLDLKPDNVVIVDGVGGLLAPDFVAQTLSGHDVSGDPLLLRFHLAFWLFVVALGVGYGLAAHRLSQGLDEVAILVAGGLGKVAAAALWIEMLVHGLATPMVLAAVTFDGSHGVLFLIRVLTLRR